jgi:hypothetical protein
VKPNLDSQGPRRAVAAGTTEDLVADSAADSAVEWVRVRVQVLVLVVARSMSPTFVSSPFIFLFNFCRAILLTFSP